MRFSFRNRMCLGGQTWYDVFVGRQRAGQRGTFIGIVKQLTDGTVTAVPVGEPLAKAGFPNRQAAAQWIIDTHYFGGSPISS